MRKTTTYVRAPALSPNENLEVEEMAGDTYSSGGRVCLIPLLSLFGANLFQSLESMSDAR